MDAFQALYFPYASVERLGTLKSLLLYFDKIWVLSSRQGFASTTGAFRELLEEGELAGWVDTERLVVSNRDLIRNAIEIDLCDQQFLDLTDRPGSHYDIYPDKGIHWLAEVLDLEWQSATVVRVPFDKGESFLINAAILALTKGDLGGGIRPVPLTDEEEHLALLHHKLRRGAKAQVERLYSDRLERATREELISSIGRQALRAVLPEPEDLEQIPLDRIVSFRMEHNEERREFRDAISNAMAEIIYEQPDASVAHIEERMSTLVGFRLKELEYAASWRRKILNGFRTLSNVPKSALRSFAAYTTGVPLELAIAGAAADASGPVLDFVDDRLDVFRTSDVTYLYQVKKELS